MMIHFQNERQTHGHLSQQDRDERACLTWTGTKWTRKTPRNPAALRHSSTGPIILPLSISILMGKFASATTRITATRASDGHLSHQPCRRRNLNPTTAAWAPTLVLPLRCSHYCQSSCLLLYAYSSESNEHLNNLSYAFEYRACSVNLTRIIH